MLGAVDLMKRPLKIPSKFIPYLETHRIYELFHEIAIQLVIKKPSDHILYMKQCLRHAAKCQDTPRIILFSPPNFNKDLLAEYLEKKLGISSVLLQNISAIETTADNLANNVRNILRERYFQNKSGWIFKDFPTKKLEARALQRIGILPTHVIEIVWSAVPSDFSSTHDIVESHESVKNLNGNDSKFQNCDDYNSQICGLREAYDNHLITVETAGRTFEELGNACISMIKKQRICVPCIFRLVLIGSRGSGRRSVANYLSNTYGLVHIDFDYLLKQTRKQNSSLSETLRYFERRWGAMPKADTRIKVVENKLMTHDCFKRGWVLTGYPITVEDFKLLDLLATPPNRIICLNVSQMVCRERLLSHRFNITESEHHLPLDNNFPSYLMHGFTTHSNKYQNDVEQDLQEYEENIEALLQYAGKSVEIVDGMADKKTVCERVDACLARPIARPTLRVSKFSKNIDPMTIEFDPDDEPDPKIFNTIRMKESILSLV